MNKHVSTPPTSRRVKPHYDHVADKKKPSLMEALAPIAHTIGEIAWALSNGFTKGVSDARQRNAHTKRR
jgi:hypothetical protein